MSKLREAGYKFFQTMVVIHMVYFICMMINGVIAENGISEKFSPREIVLGRAIDFKKDCRVPFGLYVEASRDDVVTNTTRDCTHACITLGPSGNIQGSVMCFDLLTDMVVICHTVTELPMPDWIIRLANK